MRLLVLVAGTLPLPRADGALFREQDLAGVCLWAADGVREPAETFKLVRRHILE